MKRFAYMARHFHSRDRKGFTLLEILLAIVILGTVLSTVFASYTGTFRVINDIDVQLEIYEMARTALDRIVEDLEAVYVPASTYGLFEEFDAEPWHLFTGEENSLNGEDADTLTFSSRAHIHFGPENESRGTANITYYVEESEDAGPLVLLRRDRLLLKRSPGDTEEGGGFPLCEGLASVDFKFYDFDGEEQETWSIQQEESLPIMVGVSLEFVDPAGRQNRYRFSTKIGLPVNAVEEDEE